MNDLLIYWHHKLNDISKHHTFYLLHTTQKAMEFLISKALEYKDDKVYLRLYYFPIPVSWSECIDFTYLLKSLIKTPAL